MSVAIPSKKEVSSDPNQTEKGKKTEGVRSYASASHVAYPSPDDIAPQLEGPLRKRPKSPGMHRHTTTVM